LTLAAARSAGTTAWTTFAARTALASAFPPRAAMTTMTALPTVSTFPLPFARRSAFCAWRCGGSCCLFLFLFLCHLVHPFSNFFRISFSMRAKT
jgi:hypothetical protein